MSQQYQAVAAGGSLSTLWSLGSPSELDDSELLARFLLRRDGAAEAAFRVIVERHGGMVLQACRRLLGNAHDSQDAAQAVFLILARNGRSIRSRGSLAPWLHGVARRVAARANRRALNRRTTEAKAIADGAGQPACGSLSEPVNDWEAIHAEIARLPEKYRVPIILCYLEGLTYEQAAHQIGIPVGTVRVRLSRARERLRRGLERRGFGPACFAQSLVNQSAQAAIDAAGPAIPARWIEATTRSALAFVSGQTLAVEMVSAGTLVLCREVLRAMVFSKLKFAVLGLVGLGLLTTVGGVLVGQETRRDPVKKQPERLGNQAAGTPLSPRQELANRIVMSANTRLNAQRAFFYEGRITIDRYIEASRQVRDAESRVANTKDQRIAAARAHLDRVSEVLNRETSELSEGRGTISDVTEAEEALDLAALEFYDVHAAAGGHDARAIEQLLATLKKQHEDAQSAIAGNTVPKK